jgi:hypothetical protein
MDAVVRVAVTGLAIAVLQWIVRRSWRARAMRVTAAGNQHGAKSLAPSSSEAKSPSNQSSALSSLQTAGFSLHPGPPCTQSDGHSGSGVVLLHLWDLSRQLPSASQMLDLPNPLTLTMPKQNRRLVQVYGLLPPELESVASSWGTNKGSHVKVIGDCLLASNAAFDAWVRTSPRGVSTIVQFGVALPTGDQGQELKRSHT